MAGLVPAIHVFNPFAHSKTWMPARQVYAAYASLAASTGMMAGAPFAYSVSSPGIGLMSPLPGNTLLASTPSSRRR